MRSESVESGPGSAVRLKGRQLRQPHAGGAHGLIDFEHGTGKVGGVQGAQQIAQGIGILGQELIESVDRRSLLEGKRFLLAQHAEARVDAGQNGILAQEAGAEAVHGGDIGP